MCGECQVGFMFIPDIDECIAMEQPCDANANCTNTDGSYVCTCSEGYTGDGTLCSGTEDELQLLGVGQ